LSESAPSTWDGFFMDRTSRRLIFGASGVALLVALTFLIRSDHPAASPAFVSMNPSYGCAGPRHALTEHRSRVWVTFTATVDRLLADDTTGLVHQRFITRCASGQTILVVNDTSIGMRAPVHPGSLVSVRGVFIWNRQGGLVHFTHHAVGGGPGGWIIVENRRYSLMFPLVALH
jgi:hypothetical protein